MDALNVMDGRTERGGRFFFGLMRRQERSATRRELRVARYRAGERRRSATHWRHDNNKLYGVNEAAG